MGFQKGAATAASRFQPLPPPLSSPSFPSSFSSLSPFFHFPFSFWFLLRRVLMTLFINQIPPQSSFSVTMWTQGQQNCNSDALHLTLFQCKIMTDSWQGLHVPLIPSKKKKINMLLDDTRPISSCRIQLAPKAAPCYAKSLFVNSVLPSDWFECSALESAHTEFPNTSPLPVPSGGTRKREPLRISSGAMKGSIRELFVPDHRLFLTKGTMPSTALSCVQLVWSRMCHRYAKPSGFAATTLIDFTLELFLLWRLWNSGKPFGRTIWDSSSQGKSWPSLQGKFFSVYFGPCHKYMHVWKYRFSTAMCILASITHMDAHGLHVLFLLCKETFRLEETYVVWQRCIRYKTLLRGQSWITRWVCLSLDFLVSRCPFSKQSCWLRNSDWHWVTALPRSCLNACGKLCWYINPSPNNPCEVGNSRSVIKASLGS